MGKPTLSPEDQEIFDHSVATGSVLQSTNGSQELRDALTEIAEDEDPTAGGEWILAVNGERSVRDQLTGYTK